jgi:hypothetical protein
MGKLLMALVAAVLLSCSAMGFVSAIPESDLYHFKSAVREYVPFDAYVANMSHGRYYFLKQFWNSSDSYYMVLRVNAGDTPPYDDFFVRFICSGDSLPTEFHTTDYPSWVSDGQISVKRGYFYFYDEVYDTVSIPAAISSCQILTASNLTVSGNAGYTTFNLELVPTLNTIVITLDQFCSDRKRANLTGRIGAGILTVLENNVNFLYTLWIVFQVIGVIVIVIGVPVFVLLLIRWAVWRISGHKMFERRSDGQ